MQFFLALSLCHTVQASKETNQDSIYDYRYQVTVTIANYLFIYLMDLYKYKYRCTSTSKLSLVKRTKTFSTLRVESREVCTSHRFFYFLKVTFS